METWKLMECMWWGWIVTGFVLGAVSGLLVPHDPWAKKLSTVATVFLLFFFCAGLYALMGWLLVW